MDPRAAKRRRVSGPDAQSRARPNDVLTDQQSPARLGSESENDSTDEQNGIAEHASAANGGIESQHSRPNGVSTMKRISKPQAAPSTSNVFTLQSEELLRQVRPRPGKRETLIDETLGVLKNIVERIPSREPLTIVEAEQHLQETHKISIPFPRPKPVADSNLKFIYQAPLNINVVGSYVLKTATAEEGKVIVDMTIEMPSTMFTEKDFLNLRYFHKRAYYIACVAAGIQDSDFTGTLRFENLHGNALQPIILVQADEDTDFRRAKCDIRIIPIISQNQFEIKKTLPDRNCIRFIREQGEEIDVTPGSSTPFYNSTIRVDSSFRTFLKLLHTSASKCPGFRDACILGRVWLRQRGLGSQSQSGGFGNFEWSILMALLLKGGGVGGKPVLSLAYSSIQMFRATLQFLATRNVLKNPLSIEAEGFEIPKISNVPVIFDGSTALNVLYKMTPWSYKLLIQEAQNSMKTLTTPSINQFDATFIIKVSEPLLRYDLLVKLPIKLLVNDQPNMDYIGTNDGLLSKVYNLLQRGLGDRAQHISIFPIQSEPWELGSSKTLSTLSQVVTIGIAIDFANASRAIDRGPSAEATDAISSFRDFWGSKSELRRFKDGQILESVVWDGKDAFSILEEVICHLMETNFAIKKRKSITFIQQSSVLPITFDHSDTSFSAALNTYKEFERTLRSLEDLPLQIRHLQPASSTLSYSSIETPTSDHKSTQIADIVVQFEGSGRWPDDLAAIQMTKIAFLLKIQELLQASRSELILRIGLENESSNVLNRSFLDVIYPSGVAFRLRIHHDRESTLLERQLVEKTVSGKDKEMAAVALAMYKRTFLQAPLQTQTIQTLATRFPSFSGTIRLLKKWFTSHLISSYFPEPLVELFAASIYLHPWPWRIPNSPISGFLRTILFLSRWDWSQQPLIVDFGEDLKAEQLSVVNTRFEAWRKIDPNMNRVAIFAATNFDTDGVTWTDNGMPSKILAGRMTALAKATYAEISRQGLNLDIRSLFKSSLASFDFVIHLNPRFSGQRQTPNAKFKNLQKQSDSNLAGFSPALTFVEQLRSTFGDSAVFFLDESERTTLAGLWSPHTANRRWKAGLAYSTVPARVGKGSENDAQLNKDAVLAEIARLGGELISRIEAGVGY